jgi:hypothetical protein
MKFIIGTIVASLFALLEMVAAHPHALHTGREVRRAEGHRFTLKNNCPNAVQAKVFIL